MLVTPWHTSQLRIRWFVPLEGLPKPTWDNNIIHLNNVSFVLLLLYMYSLSL